MTDNRLKPLDITPNSPQQEIWLNIGATQLPPGPQQYLCVKGKGSGYSFASGVVALRWLLAKPGTLVLLIRRTRTSIRESTMRTWLEHAIPRQFVHSYSKVTGCLELINGSKVHTIGIANNPDDLKSIECSLAIVDEASQISEEDINIIIARIRERHPCGNALLLISNPVPVTHWLYEKSKDPNLTFITDKTASNPHLGPDYERTLRKFYGDQAPHYLDCKWFGAQAQRLTGYSPVPFDEFPTTAPDTRFIGVDIGGGGKGASKCAIALIARYANLLDKPAIHAGIVEYPPRDVWVVEREAQLASTVHSEIIGTMADLWTAAGEADLPTVASDPANAYFNREITRLGFRLLPVNKYRGSVSSGEILINSLMANHQLLIHPQCPLIHEAIQKYDGTQEYKDFVDAIRYGVTATIKVSQGIVL